MSEVPKNIHTKRGVLLYFINRRRNVYMHTSVSNSMAPIGTSNSVSTRNCNSQKERDVGADVCLICGFCAFGKLWNVCDLHCFGNAWKVLE